MKQLTISILGAGIAGICCAIALSRKGFKVTLFERSSTPQNIGAGLVLWPNANVILDQLEILDDIKSIGYSLDKMSRYNVAGVFLNEIDLKHFTSNAKYSNYALTRKSLHAILIKNLQKYSVTIHYNFCVTTIKPKTNNTAVIHFENGQKNTADIIIGAEGRMHSLARQYVIGNNKPIYQGYVNWVGIIEQKAEIQFKQNILDYWGCGERFGIVPLSTQSAYWAGCKAMPEGLGLPRNGNKKALLDIFQDWPDDINAIIEQTPEQHIKRIEVFDLEPITSWYRDNVCLIGDAAHAALPTSGQGACQAIEDAYFLAESLTQNHATTNYQAAFEHFYQTRAEITRNITQNARDFTRILFNTDPKFCAERDLKTQQQ